MVAAAAVAARVCVYSNRYFSINSSIHPSIPAVLCCAVLCCTCHVTYRCAFGSLVSTSYSSSSSQTALCCCRRLLHVADGHDQYRTVHTSCCCCCCNNNNNATYDDDDTHRAFEMQLPSTCRPSAAVPSVIPIVGVCAFTFTSCCCRCCWDDRPLQKGGGRETNN